MSEVKIMYTQECDLCHKVVNTSKYGLDSITVPYVTRVPGRILRLKLSLCPCCYERFGRILSNYFDFENKQWKDDVKE